VNRAAKPGAAPAADKRVIRLRLMAQRLDREAMIRFFAWDPEREGVRSWAAQLGVVDSLDRLPWAERSR
jgi:hypothetical protein